MSKIRGFEVAKGFEDKDINLPIKMTEGAAGYDVEAAEDVEIPSMPRMLFNLALDVVKTTVTSGLSAGLSKVEEFKDDALKPTSVPTGIKVYMQDDEVVYLFGRSSTPLKRFLLFACGVAVIDFDYYENEKNDGHIYFQFINFSMRNRIIKKHERVGQAVFQNILRADKGKCRIKNEKRKGGHGSTDGEV